MEFIPIKRSENHKEQIIEILKKHEEESIVIIMSNEWFNTFVNREDVEKDMYDLNSTEDIIYIIYENSKRTFDEKMYGRMNFCYINGLFFLKSCDFINYGILDKQKKIIFLE